MEAVDRAVAGWRDALMAADRLPVMVVSCWGVMAVVPQITPSLVGTLLVQAAALASMLIAAHRLWLLGERTDRPIWRLPPGYLDFVLWLLAFVLAFAPAVWVWPLHPEWAAVLAGIAGVFSLGTMTLLPGIAIGDPSARYLACYAAILKRAVPALLALAIGAVPGVALLGLSHTMHGAAPLLDPTARLLLALPLAAISARYRPAAA